MEPPPTRRRHAARLALVALVMAVMASCGSDTESGAGSSELSAAIDRMTTLRSVRMVGRASGPNTTDDVVTIVYQAPDRLHSVQTGTEEGESFYIGSTLYQGELGRPGYLRTATMPSSQPTAQTAVFGLLQAMRAGGPVRKGNTYRVALPDGGSMVATVEDGYVTELTTTDSDGVRRVQQYSQFNSAPDVIAPPADRVLAPLPTAPKCAGGQPPPSTFLCIN